MACASQRWQLITICDELQTLWSSVFDQFVDIIKISTLTKSTHREVPDLMPTAEQI